MAAVNGAGVGLGLTMLAHCDLVLVSERARLLAPFTAMGVAPEAASSYLLPRRMGRQQATRYLFTSEWISAEEAVDTGLAVAVCEADQLIPEALALATQIAGKSLPSLMATKRLLLESEREGIVARQRSSKARRSPSCSGSRTHAMASSRSSTRRRPTMTNRPDHRIEEIPRTLWELVSSSAPRSRPTW